MKERRVDTKALTTSEFDAILKKIEEKHSFGKYGHTNWVKYVRPSFDMRDGKCFFIKLDDKVFDSSKCRTTMFEEINAWLDRKVGGQHA